MALLSASVVTLRLNSPSSSSARSTRALLNANSASHSTKSVLLTPCVPSRECSSFTAYQSACALVPHVNTAKRINAEDGDIGSIN